MVLMDESFPDDVLFLDSGNGVFFGVSIITVVTNMLGYRENPVAPKVVSHKFSRLKQKDGFNVSSKRAHDITVTVERHGV